MPFTNLNQCYSFSCVANNSTAIKLSSFSCSEVNIFNPTSNAAVLLVYDVNTTNDARAFGIPAGETFSMKGVTDSSNLSAKFLTAPTGGTIYCRTQYYTHSTQSYG
jgi:hypothetical protein